MCNSVRLCCCCCVVVVVVIVVVVVVVVVVSGQPMGVILTHYDLSLKHAAVLATAAAQQCISEICT